MRKFTRQRILKSALVGALVAAIVACGTENSTIPSSSENAIIAPIAEDPRPQVIAGWLDAYSDAIESTVSTKYPALLSLGATRMATVCPAWGSLTPREREKFWSALLWSIAGPESGRNRTVIFRETSLPIDSVTGQQIRSEGLLQLSYVDVVSYRYPGGDVSWTHDRTMALSDYAKALKLGNPTRTILGAYANLNLGLWIMNRRLTALDPASKLEASLGKYWATMRAGSSAFAKVLSGLRSRMPDCF